MPLWLFNCTLMWLLVVEEVVWRIQGKDEQTLACYASQNNGI